MFFMFCDPCDVKSLVIHSVFLLGVIHTRIDSKLVAISLQDLHFLGIPLS